MRKIALTLGVALGLVAAAPASAQGMMDTVMRGLYAGGSIGQSKLKGACDDLGPGFTCDDKDKAWRILAGYQINRNFAAEIGYSRLGKASLSGPGGSDEIKVSVGELVGIGAFPVWDKLSLYGKLGVYHGELKGGGGKESNNGLTYGLGAQYDFTQFDVIKNLGVRLEWQKYNNVGGNDLESDVEVLSIGAIWRFQ